ncbi:MAG: hypothetical protein D6710_11315 [Nitrospirae bacterium]|nr:MAG: hypothetical protein D6710_11315 [Nitrospirota bacterium]
MVRLIDVRTYSGRRADEYPLQINVNGRWLDVKVFEQHIEEDLLSRCRKRVFYVEDSEGNSHCIYYDMGLRLWFIKD